MVGVGNRTIQTVTLHEPSFAIVLDGFEYAGFESWLGVGKLHPQRFNFAKQCCEEVRARAGALQSAKLMVPISRSEIGAFHYPSRLCESVSNSRLLVVVATYNEIDNLPRLVLQISELLPDADVLVIDDASPDGTGNWCEQSAAQYPNLSVLHRSAKLGLGTAAVAGFKYAKDQGYDLVATMDADLSHDPKSLAEMFELSLHSDCADIGVFVGSRYVTGGGTEGWPFIRRLASRAVNKFARTMLKLKTYDNSGAFRIYRSSALDKIDLQQLRSTDFAYLEEILWRLSKQEVAMMEYPILFRNRELGRSKTNPILGLRVFWQIMMMGIGIWK